MNPLAREGDVSCCARFEKSLRDHPIAEHVLLGQVLDHFLLRALDVELRGPDRAFG